MVVQDGHLPWWPQGSHMTHTFSHAVPAHMATLEGLNAPYELTHYCQVSNHGHMCWNLNDSIWEVLYIQMESQSMNVRYKNSANMGTL